MHFERAAECIEDAQLLLTNSRLTAVAGRAYYAMFHAVTAILLTKNIKRSSHRGIISAFGEYFVKSGLLDQRFHQYLIEAFELRQQTDYEPVTDIDSKQAKQLLDQAIEFVDACRKLCE